MNFKHKRIILKFEDDNSAFARVRCFNTGFFAQLCGRTRQYGRNDSENVK